MGNGCLFVLKYGRQANLGKELVHPDLLSSDSIRQSKKGQRAEFEN